MNSKRENGAVVAKVLLFLFGRNVPCSGGGVKERLRAHQGRKDQTNTWHAVQRLLGMIQI